MAPLSVYEGWFIGPGKKNTLNGPPAQQDMSSRKEISLSRKCLRDPTCVHVLYWGNIRVILGLHWDTGKENGNGLERFAPPPIPKWHGGYLRSYKLFEYDPAPPPVVLWPVIRFLWVE